MGIGNGGGAVRAYIAVVVVKGYAFIGDGRDTIEHAKQRECRGDIVARRAGPAYAATGDDPRSVHRLCVSGNSIERVGDGGTRSIASICQRRPAVGESAAIRRRIAIFDRIVDRSDIGDFRPFIIGLSYYEIVERVRLVSEFQLVSVGVGN